MEYELKFKFYSRNRKKMLQGAHDISKGMPMTGNFIWLQSTGIKDIANNLIYDGDILKGNHPDNFVIERINGALQMLNIKFIGQPHNELVCECTGNPQTKGWLEQSTIIGNIYENLNK